jgi:plasmid stability protein
MATITLKNIPAPVHRALQRQAKAHGRSLNREAILCLEKALLPRQISRKDLLNRIQEHRQRLNITIDDQWLAWAKREGRS